MSFDDLGRYTASHKAWDHVGNIIPPVEFSEGARPNLGDCGKVASWLPVQFKDKKMENWYVVLPGKPVALDPDGCLMPAEYGLTSATVTYTQNDVDAGVIDIATGLPLTATKSVALANLTGTRGGSWTAALAGTDNSTHASGFMGRFGVSFSDSVAKYPIGVAPYPYLQWAGGDGFNPSSYSKHNYNMQHRVAINCDYTLKLPLVPAQDATDTVPTTATDTALVFGTLRFHTRANAVANATGRYNATTGTYPVLSTYPVMALALDDQNLAKQTSRTTLALASNNTSDDVSSILVNEMSSLSGIHAAGDYWVDYEKGVIFIYSSDGATLPTAISGASGTLTITYYRYGTAPSTVSKFACVLAGGIVGGDFLKVGTNSNYVKADPTVAADVPLIMGQVIGFEYHPKSGLDRVRTAYNPALTTDASGAMANGSASSASTNAGQMDQMPGSATGGYPDLLHYAGGADMLAIVNLILR